MKKSELKNYIRENIISTLSEDTDAEIEKTKELTAAVKDLDVAKKEAGIKEANIGLADLEEIGYTDGDKAVAMHFNQDVIGINNEIDYKYYRRGFLQSVKDSTASYKLEENFADLSPEDKKRVGIEYDYEDIGQFYLEGKYEEHNLTQDQLGKLGKKVTDKFYNGDIAKAYDDVYKTSRKDSIKEDEDKEPSKSDMKKTKGLAKAKDELALLTREMKSLAKKYSKAEGEEKEKLVKTLKAKTKLKKELESILDKKKI